MSTAQPSGNEMPFSHGTKKAYEIGKCRCDDCVQAQRARWNLKDARRKAREAGAPLPPSLGPVTPIGRARAGKDQIGGPQGGTAQVIRFPLWEPSPNPPSEVPEIPHMWQSTKEEPSYAQEQRDALAQVVNAITASPETECRSVGFTPETTKQEAKDFARLVTKFQKINPGIIHVERDEYRGFTAYRFTFYSTTYRYAEPEPEPEITESGEPELETIGQWKIDVPPIATSKPEPAKIDYRFKTNPMTGICTIHINGEYPCSNGADGTYTVSGRIVCVLHYNLIRDTYPERVSYRREIFNTYDGPAKPRNVTGKAPSVGTSPVRGPQTR